MRFLICILCTLVVGCGHFSTQKEISSVLDSSVGKSYVPNTGEKLIREDEDLKYYQFRVTESCSWIIKVNKK